MYYLLTASFKEQHGELIKIILEAVDADKIYFLGSTLMRRRTESIFMTDAPSCSYVSHYYVLVLIRNGQGLNTIQDKIENNCRHFISVTAIVLYTDQFNQWLIEGHQFAQTVYRKAILLHGEKESIPEAINAELNKTDNGSIMKQGINKVTEFLAGADLFRRREQNKMAAFMLHQAAEQAFYTLFTITTGLHVHTHNLDKLIRYCSMVSYNIADIFPRNNEKNVTLFGLLQRAYTDARYKEDYTIRTDDLVTLTEKVKLLAEILKKCKAS